jgi:hypothetical protein
MFREHSWQFVVNLQPLQSIRELTPLGLFRGDTMRCSRQLLFCCSPLMQMDARDLKESVPLPSKRGNHFLYTTYKKTDPWALGHVSEQAA